MDFQQIYDNHVFDVNLYRMYYTNLVHNIEMQKRSAFSLMNLYVDSVKAENYERAKAITDVLKPLGYNTADTHYLLPNLN